MLVEFSVLTEGISKIICLSTMLSFYRVYNNFVKVAVRMLAHHEYYFSLIHNFQKV